MKINEVTDNFIILYRGDSTKIDNFDIDKTDDHALFGIGIYLTNDPVIAKDYTLKSSSHLIFDGDRDSKCTSERELIIRYLKKIIDEELHWEETKEEIRNKWQQYYYKNIEKSENIQEQYKNDLKKFLQNCLKKAKQIYRQRRPNMKIAKNVLGEYMFMKSDRVGNVARFNVPLSYINKTLHTEKPLPDTILQIIRQLFVDNGWKLDRMDLRIPDDKEGEIRVSFDEFIEAFKVMKCRMPWTELYYGGNGENPSYDFMKSTYPGETLFRNIEVQKIFINKLQSLGYVGFEYEGGKRVSGTGTRGGGREGQLHRCFVLWDAKQLSHFRLEDDTVTDDTIENELEKSVRSSNIYK